MPTTLRPEVRAPAPKPRRAGLRISVKELLSNQSLSAIGLFVLYLTAPFGAINGILFAPLSALIIARAPNRVLRIAAKYWWALPYPLFCLCTVMWSEAPAITLKASLEMILTVLAGLVLGSYLRGPLVVILVFISTFLLICTGLDTVLEAVRYHVPFTGRFASKNIEAFVSHACFTAAVTILVGRGFKWSMRLFALAVIPLSVATLFLARSGGGTVSLGITCVTLLAGLMYMRAGRWRPLALVTLALIGLAAIPAIPLIKEAWSWFQWAVLHKDSTLTGRTYLWQFAYRLIFDHPIGGRGAFAFWRPDNIDAEGLYERFQVTAFYGFNFHNTFIETTVEDGYIGLACLLLYLGGVAWRILAGFARDPTPAKLFFLAYFVAWFARLGTEVIIGPLDAQAVLLGMAAVLGGERLRLPSVRRRPPVVDRYGRPIPWRLALPAPPAAESPPLLLRS